MKLQTKYFGAIDYQEQECLSFPVGLFGFEEEGSFLLLPFEGSGQGMLCLQSTKTPSLAFVLLDPFCLDPDYAPVLQPAELRLLEAEDMRELCFYVLCAVKEPVSESTVNLRCPVVVQPRTRQARQIIMETRRYTMRHKLGQFRRSEGAAVC